MRIHFDASQINAEYQRSRTIEPVFKEVVKIRVMEQSLKVLGQVKIVMPVDTGAARARWGVPGAAGGIWREEKYGMEITQGAALEPHEYIIELNEGSSQQAPAGFIDAIAYKAEEELTQKILDDLVKGFRV